MVDINYRNTLKVSVSILTRVVVSPSSGLERSGSRAAGWAVVMLQRAWPTWPNPGLARLARLAWLACLLCNNSALANSFEPGQSDKEILDILAHHNRCYPPLHQILQFNLGEISCSEPSTGLGLG